MNRRSSATFSALLALPLICGAIAFAQRISPAAPPSKSPAARSAATSVRPDPALLDGSAHPAEKRNEFGMIGEFEIPGDETRSDRVGGQQGQPSGSGTDPAQQGGGGGLPMPAGGQPPPNAGGAAAAIPASDSAAGGGGEQQQGAQGGGTADPLGTAAQPPGGMQVGQLSGPGGGPMPGSEGNRPRPVTIGDKAMQIPMPNAATRGVSAVQPPGSTQHHGKPTGTGGKPPEGDNTNKGSERGRTMPAGL